MGQAEFDVRVAGGLEALTVFGEGEGAGDAAHGVAAFGALVGGEAVVGDDVGDTDSAAGLDAAGGEQEVDAGAEVQDALAFVQVGDSGGVAAAQQGADRLGGRVSRSSAA
ncbi:MAG: hypothetical protein QOF84_2128 [Streptomyces sp.]|jgi:hypothetical protein|nr:hypothetical protein [Streptomyces sp.]